MSNVNGYNNGSNKGNKNGNKNGSRKLANKYIDREITRDGVMLNCPSVINTNDDISKISIMTPQIYGRKEEAWFLLHKISSMVAPLMQKHGFKVKHLSEFYNPKLLGININRGQKIQIRLRKNEDKDQFLPLGSLLGTMLHELTHNIIGPHNEQFHKFTKDMVSELEDMMAKGFTGSGFFSAGKRLGVVPKDINYSRFGITDSSSIQAFSKGPGRRLGGGTSSSTTTNTVIGNSKGNNNNNSTLKTSKTFQKKSMRDAILQALDKRLPPKPISNSKIDKGKIEPKKKSGSSLISSSNSQISMIGGGSNNNNNDYDEYEYDDELEILGDDDLRILEIKTKPGAYAKLKIEIADHSDDDFVITTMSNNNSTNNKKGDINNDTFLKEKKEEKIDLIDLTDD